MNISVNQAHFEVEVKGEGDPLLLIHGFPLDHSMWDAQIDQLSESFQVIAPDLRGFGMSEVSMGTVSMEQHADDLIAILEHLNINQPVHVCGLSMGGYVTWQLIRKYSENIKSVILCDTRAASDSEEAVQNRMKMVETILSEGTEPVSEAMIPKLVSGETIKSKPEIVERLTNTILDTHPQSMASALRGMAERPDSTSMLPTLKMPVLLIVGEEDQLSSPEEMKAVADQIPNSQFEIIKGAGHMAPMECPEEVNRILQTFLSS